jgi:hypothetical protein
MDRIHYAGESLITGSDIASALLDYAQALAGAGSSDTVEIPIRDDDGTERRATFVIGPASQLVSIAEPAGHPELEDADVVASLHEKAAALGTTVAVSGDDSLFAPDADFEL